VNIGVVLLDIGFFITFVVVLGSIAFMLASWIGGKL